jgi:hypothetical protein
LQLQAVAQAKSRIVYPLDEPSSAGDLAEGASGLARVFKVTNGPYAIAALEAVPHDEPHHVKQNLKKTRGFRSSFREEGLRRGCLHYPKLSVGRHRRQADSGARFYAVTPFESGCTETHLVSL